VNDAAEKPWVVNESVEKRAEVDHSESQHDETPSEEDRTEEAERLHAPARQREPLGKQTQKRE
jgi:hypothetical protein